MRATVRALLQILFVLAAVVALGLVGLPGPLYRFGAIRLGTAFSMIVDGAWVGIVAGIVALVTVVVASLLREKALALTALVALAASAIAFGLPYSWLEKARAVPPIHDVTTDPAHPPAFRAILRTHPVLVNSPVYGGGSPEASAQELRAVRGYLDARARGHGPHARAARALLAVCRRWNPACLGGVTRVFYPAVRLLVVPGVDLARAVRVARRLMKDRGWTIVTTRRKGRLEAVARTPWFGFYDDVALRVRPLPTGGVRIDMRSESRIGLSDIGRNAARVTAFLRALARKLGGRFVAPAPATAVPAA